LITWPKSSQASGSKTELKPQPQTRSPHDREPSNTRFDNNSTIGAASITENAGTFTVAGAGVGSTFSIDIDGTTVTGTVASGDGFGDTNIGVAAQIAQAIKDQGIKGLTVVSGTGVNADKFTLSRDGSVSIASASAAATAIANIDTALTRINTQRANLGAVSNRLDNTVSNLTNVVINLEGGRGRIEDADFAAESTSLAKSQILQQASTAMLAQANASKQSVLSLLQG
jgi:flagellin